MSRTFIVRPRAEADLGKAFRWYEEQRLGLGLDFLKEVEHAFERIAELPLGAVVLYRNARRVLVKRFPYGVFYVVNETSVRIVAVAHHSQDPSEWKNRT